MTTAKQLALILALSLCALLATAHAQTARVSTVNVTSEGERVKIAAQGDISEMRIEVSDEQGDMVFQSGAITGQQLDWNMKDSHGERVAAGTYLVTVTYRNAAGKVKKRVEQVTVDEAEKVEAKRTLAPEAVQATVVTYGTTTAGKIPKFYNSSAITNSIITESAGKIGIGTAAPLSKLHILSAAADKPPRLQSTGTSSFAAGWDFYHGTAGKGYVGVPGTGVGSPGPGEMLLYGGTGVETSLWAGGVRAMTIATTGKVGIGTTTPIYGRLHVEGGNGGGVYASATGAGAAGTGVWGQNTGSGYGVRGISGSSYGVYGSSTSGSGVYGSSGGRAGVLGTTSYASGSGVEGNASGSNAAGVFGVNPSGAGVWGRSTNGSGVYGESNLRGVYGYSGASNGTGVAGYSSTSGNGVYGQSTSGRGVYGYSDSGKGVYGYSDSGSAVSGYSASGYAGHFEGKVFITGKLTVDDCEGCRLIKSDQNLKANFSTVNPRLVLDRLSAIPIKAWNYKSDEPSVRHIGPMAQDFRAAFNLGVDDKHIDMIDANGVTMAAIQGLYQQNQELTRTVKQQSRQIEQLQVQLNQVKRTIKRKRAMRKH